MIAGTVSSKNGVDDRSPPWPFIAAISSTSWLPQTTATDGWPAIAAAASVTSATASSTNASSCGGSKNANMQSCQTRMPSRSHCSRKCRSS